MGGVVSTRKGVAAAAVIDSDSQGGAESAEGHRARDAPSSAQQSPDPASGAEGSTSSPNQQAGSVQHDEDDVTRGNVTEDDQKESDKSVLNLKMRMLRLKHEQREEDEGKMKNQMAQQQLDRARNVSPASPAPPLQHQQPLSNPKPRAPNDKKQRASRRMSMVPAKDLESLPPFLLINVSQIVIR